MEYMKNWWRYYFGRRHKYIIVPFQPGAFNIGVFLGFSEKAIPLVKLGIVVFFGVLEETFMFSFSYGILFKRIDV